MAFIIGDVAAAALAPLAIVGAIVCFLGYAIKAWIFPETKPIGLWAKNGPFGKLPFMGYKQGAPIKDEMPANQRKAARNNEKGIDERYIAWCDHPEEAYRAIRDALFRPTIEMQDALTNMYQLISIKVKVPYKTHKSYLTIQYEHIEQLWEKRGDEYVLIQPVLQPSPYGSDDYNHIKPGPLDDQHVYGGKICKKTTKIIRYVENPVDLAHKGNPDNHPLSDLKEDPPGTYHLQIKNHTESWVIVKVRLHVTDDGDFVIPYEPVFDDAGEEHWVSTKKRRFYNPRCTIQKVSLRKT